MAVDSCSDERAMGVSPWLPTLVTQPAASRADRSNRDGSSEQGDCALRAPRKRLFSSISECWYNVPDPGVAVQSRQFCKMLAVERDNLTSTVTSGGGDS